MSIRERRRGFGLGMLLVIVVLCAFLHYLLGVVWYLLTLWRSM